MSPRLDHNPMTQGETRQGWRGSADLWLSAAQAALLDGGIDAVKIQPLAKQLGLARTSFYWFFDSREALLAQLLARWREKNTGNLVRQTGAYAESVTEAMLNVIDCWLDPALFDARFEFAVRSWAMQSAAVEGEVRGADGDRLAALAAMLARYGGEAGLIDARARATYLTQIGYISMRTSEDLATRLARIPAYVEVFTGSRPSPSELARFCARHGFAAP